MFLESHFAETHSVAVRNNGSNVTSKEYIYVVRLHGNGRGDFQMVEMGGGGGGSNSSTNYHTIFLEL